MCILYRLVSTRLVHDNFLDFVLLVNMYMHEAVYDQNEQIHVYTVHKVTRLFLHLHACIYIGLHVCIRTLVYKFNNTGKV